MEKRILLIEDDKALSNGICCALRGESMQIDQCFLLSKAKIYCEQTKYDLLILDINLPDGNGLVFLQELKVKRNVPVILLTANDMETDIVTGLELGADDYITKPFSLAILRARVNTQLRKTEEKTGGADLYEIASFRFDFGQMLFYRDGEAVELSKTEQKLLRILVENRGRILERAVLVDRIWADGAEYVDENALSVTIKRLRDKLEENPSKPDYIKNVYGKGYIWTEREWNTALGSTSLREE